MMELMAPAAYAAEDGLVGHLLIYRFSPWKLWGYWLVHIVAPPMGLQTLSPPWLLSLAPPLGAL